MSIAQGNMEWVMILPVVDIQLLLLHRNRWQRGQMIQPQSPGSQLLHSPVPWTTISPAPDNEQSPSVRIGDGASLGFSFSPTVSLSQVHGSESFYLCTFTNVGSHTLWKGSPNSNVAVIESDGNRQLWPDCHYITNDLRPSCHSWASAYQL